MIVGSNGQQWVTILLFWSLFVTDVFAVCYWLTSRLGELLVHSKMLAHNTATIAALILGALLTPALAKGIILLLKQRG